MMIPLPDSRHCYEGPPVALPKTSRERQRKRTRVLTGVLQRQGKNHKKILQAMPNNWNRDQQLRSCGTVSELWKDNAESTRCMAQRPTTPVLWHSIRRHYTARVCKVYHNFLYEPCILCNGYCRDYFCITSLVGL